MLCYVKKILKYFADVLCIFLLLIFLGCYHAPKETGAYLDGNHGNQYWKMVEDCGYEHCYPKVDYLQSTTMTVRLELTNEKWKGENFFIVRIHFMDVREPLIFKPSKVDFNLKSGKLLKAKALNCAYTIWNVEYLRSYIAIKEPLTINKEGCYLFFFDHPILSAKDELIMDLRQAVTIGGKETDIPVVIFRRMKTDGGS